jgi:hypothetical protein
MRAIGIGAALLLTVLGFGGFAADARADVVLNEVNCEGTDWIELVNTAAEPVDVSGWLLTDAQLSEHEADHRMTFAASTSIGAHGNLVVEKGAGGFPFGISCSDTIRLADEAEAQLDETTIGQRNTSADTWGRYPNGTGTFAAAVATRGAPNQPSSGGGPDQDQAAWLYDPGSVVEVDLDMPQSSIDALAVTPDEYVDATFSLTTTGGSYGPLAVGLRLKGSGSFRTLDGKAAFKVKFSHSVPGQRFLGLKALSLNNMVQDPSMVREVVSYELFRGAGVAAPRTGYAFVQVNGADYGVYLNVENPDEIMARRWFSGTRHLYEGGYRADATPSGMANLEVDEGSETDLSDLEALVAGADSHTGDWSDQISPLLDLEQATRMWAVEAYVGHWDGYSPNREYDATEPNNFFLHSVDSGRFSMLPWGTDQTLGRRVSFDDPAGILFRRCLDDASCSALYRDAVAQVRTIAVQAGLQDFAASTATMLEPWQQRDPRREQGMQQIADGVSSVRAYLGIRPSDVDAWLSEGPAPVSGTQTIETKITGRPKARTAARRVSFGFTSSLAGAVFECKLDRGRFAPCSEPARFKVAPGRHRFHVRAKGPGGLFDQSAARFRFEVVRS